MDRKKHETEMAKQRNGRTASPKPHIWTRHVRTNGKGTDRFRTSWITGNSTGSVVIYGITAVSLALATKYAVSGLYWNLNFCFIFMQASAAIVVMVLLRFYGIVTGITAFDRRKALRWIPLSLLSVIISYISLKALQNLSLPTYTILSNLSTMTIAYAERDTSGMDITDNPTLTSFALMVLGVLGAVWSDYEVASDLRGDRRMIQTLEPNNPLINLAVGCVLMWAFTLLTTFQATITRSTTQKTNFKDWDGIWYTNLLILPISGTLSYLIEDFTPENLDDNFRPEIRYPTILALIITSILSAFLPYISFLAKRNVGENKHGIVAASNQFVMALMGLVVYGNVKGVVGGVEPVVFAGVGGVLFAWGKRKGKGRWKEEGLLPLSVVRGLDGKEG